MTDSPHVTVIGSALSGNKGASAMLEASIATITQRLPDVRFTLLSTYPEEDRALNTYDNLDIVAASPRQLGVTINLLALAHRLVPGLRSRIERQSRAIGALVDSQVLLDQGGITFTDGREKFLLYNTASILPAINVGTPVVKCAQAIGPFEHPLNRALASWFLPRMRAIVTRGRRTHEFAEGLGLKNLHEGADYAFALDMDGTEAEQVAATGFDLGWLDVVEGRRVVGVSPSAVMRKKVEARGGDYVAATAAFVDGLVAAGHRVLVIPHSVRGHTDKPHNNDMPLCREILSVAAPSPELRLLQGELPARVLREVIGRCDLFVASRFHAMVSALAMEVPTLVLGWGHKYEEVLEMFDLTPWALDDSELEPAALVDRVAALDAQSEVIRQRLADHLPRVRQLALAQADLIVSVVRTGLGRRVRPRASRTSSRNDRTRDLGPR